MTRANNGGLYKERILISSNINLSNLHSAPLCIQRLTIMNDLGLKMNSLLNAMLLFSAKFCNCNMFLVDVIILLSVYRLMKVFIMIFVKLEVCNVAFIF